ncbi:MAG TPA: prolipoprotein diacylglyceryl transferase [Thermomicrobiales bacterium]|nr:prolipoprotein diacylglyceryl transferase [Thermomicrobiales bacterium]
MPSLHDPVAIALGPLEIRWYAIFILSGIFGAVALAHWLAGKRGLDQEFIFDIAPWVVFLGIAGARLYYVLLEWDRFKDDLFGAINIRGGGLTIHGAVIAGALTVWWLCRRYREPLFTWLDIIAPGVALGQALGRWGNWANQEAFGTPTDLPWAVTIDPARRPSGYEAFATFHPTFLYESISNLVNAMLLSWLVVNGPRLKWFRDGDVIGLYLVAYGVVRFFIERIRTDSLYIGPWPAAYWLSFGLIAAGLAIMVLRRRVPAETGSVIVASREDAA